MNLLARALPLEGAGRTLALATLINTTGNGMFYAVSAIYFTQVVGLPAVQVGLGLTIAAAVGLGVGVPMGHLADVRGPREMLVVLTVLLGVAALGYLFVSGFAGFVAVALLVTLLDRSSGAARGALIATVGEPGDRVRLRAYLRAVTNVGITVGGLVGALTLAVDRPAVYRGAVALDAATYVGAALVARRLPHVPPSPHTGEGPRLVALRDRPFLVVTALNAVMALHYGLVDVALPLWVVERTHAPKWVIGLLLLANTVTVVLLQVRVSRNVATVEQGATASWRAGLVLALACAVYAASAHGGPLLAALVLVAGALAQVAGELLQAAGSWAIGFGLAPQEAQGQYQGLYSTGFAASNMLAPAVLTALVVGGGAPGWLVLGAVFTAAGLAMVPATRWALGTAPSGALVRSAVAQAQSA
ncbi:MAG TPA: MFS transporter [Motilibacteraceae bacterium]|nr:MFS transporter [Motilibacteraceae bacterium]